MYWRVCYTQWSPNMAPNVCCLSVQETDSPDSPSVTQWLLTPTNVKRKATEKASAGTNEIMSTEWLLAHHSTSPSSKECWHCNPSYGHICPRHGLLHFVTTSVCLITSCHALHRTICHNMSQISAVMLMLSMWRICDTILQL